MAVYTISQGEKITASILNTYAMNAGLVYVTSATVGSGVSSATVSNCFSTTYDNYKIMYSGGLVSVGTNYRMSLGAGSAGNYYGSQYFDVAGGGTTGTNRVSAGNNWYVGACGTIAGGNQFSIDLCSPNLATRTSFSGTYAGNNFAGWISGQLADSTAYTAFTLTADSATLTGGVITVFGYRKA
jgi:hypothetical protein